MGLRTALLLTLTLLSATLHADKRERTPAYILSEPDEYIEPLPQGAPHRSPEVSFTQRNIISRHRLSNRRGIDVSHYQGSINWRNVAIDEHASYVYIKATESSSLVDNMYRQNLRGARAAGIPAGTYHFFSPTTSVTTQLLNLTSAMPDLREQDLIPMVDVETHGKTPVAEFRQRLRQFLRGIEERYGVRPIIYTGANFFNKYLAGYFDDYLFMIAKYADTLPDLNGNPKFAIWQYSSHGQVAGIRGYVDLSRFVDNYDLRDIMLPSAASPRR
ncbi:MAG: glycosyl hydrolase family 25 [Prevotellaceae bacterium]|nr:glycosyl hydrolase family 25 [Prevotellaceae bacterium]